MTTDVHPAPAAQAPEGETGKKNSLVRFLPLALIAAAIAAFFALGLGKYMSLEALSENYAALKAFVAAHFVLALGLFVLTYIAVAAMSLPVAGVTSLVGGFLFGPVVGTVLVVFSATLGASIVFIAAKTAFGDTLRERASGWVKRTEEGFNNNAFSYLLLLRLVPIMPFFIANIAPALFGVRLRTFFFATLIGIVPGSFAYVSAGNGLGRALELGDKIELSGLLLQPAILTPIIALSVLALIPIVHKAVTRKKAAS